MSAPADHEIGAEGDAVSAWVKRFVPLIKAGGRVLDLACGSGRHAALGETPSASGWGAGCTSDLWADQR